MCGMHAVEIEAGDKLGDRLSGDSIAAEASMRVVETDHGITVVRDDAEVFLFGVDGSLAALSAAGGEVPDDVLFAVEELPTSDERDEIGRHPTFVSAELNDRRKAGELNAAPRVAAALVN